MNANNGAPKYVIKSCLSPYRKSPITARFGSKKTIIPESAIYANRKKADLKLTFTPVIHSVSNEPSITAIEAEEKVYSTKEYAVQIIQHFMKSYFSRHPNKENNNTISLL